jgi:hypothetical protein
VETNWKDEQTAACNSLRNMARPEGFEPPTPRFVEASGA